MQILWGNEIGYTKELDIVMITKIFFEKEIISFAQKITIDKANGETLRYKKDEYGDGGTYLFLPWIDQNFDTAKLYINNTEKQIRTLFDKLDCHLQLNWTIVNQKFIDLLDEIKKSYNEYKRQILGSALNNLQQEYDFAYNKSIVENSGMGFGIISNSLVAHMIYAAESAAKEIDDQKNAELAAAKAVGNNPMSGIAKKINPVLTSFYNKNSEPDLLKLIPYYYLSILEYISNGLNVSKTDFEKISSKEDQKFYLKDDADPKTAILKALGDNPYDGKVVFFALKHQVADDEFCAFLIHSSKEFKDSAKDDIETKLTEMRNRANIYMLPFYNNQDAPIIDAIRDFYGHINISDWDSIVTNVYWDLWSASKEKFNVWKNNCQEKEIVRSLKTKSSSQLIGEQKKFEEDTDIINLFFLANDLQYSKAKDLLKPFHILCMKDLIERNHSYETYVLKLEFEKNEKQKKHQEKIASLESEIQARKNSLGKLGFLLFGEKAKTKKRLLSEISELENELRQVTVRE